VLKVSKIRQADNQGRDKRRTAARDKEKKQEPFNKVLAKELTQPPQKK
jgi:uncharacterized iron-regulated protein